MKGSRWQNIRGPLFVNLGLGLLVLVWLVPTFGLFVSSFRTRFDIQTSGWWSIFPHKEWTVVKRVEPKELGLNADEAMDVEGVTATFEQLREGIETPDGLRIQWIGNRRIGWIEVQEKKWTAKFDFTLENYVQVLAGKDFEYKHPDGNVEIIPGDDFWGALFNSLAVAIPATVIPIWLRHHVPSRTANRRQQTRSRSAPSSVRPSAVRMQGPAAPSDCPRERRPV